MVLFLSTSLFLGSVLLAGDNIQDLRVLKASETCDIEMLKDALLKGGNPNAKTENYFAIDLAILSQKPSCVEILISAGAKGNPYGTPDTWKDKHVITPIVRVFTFIENKKILYEMAKILIKNGDGLDVPSFGGWPTISNEVRVSGKSCALAHLIVLSNFEGKDELVDLLITHPKSIYQDVTFWEILFEFENSKRFPWLKKIVDINGSNASWNNPNVLSIALKNEVGSQDLTRSQFLLSRGIEVRWSNVKNCSPREGNEGCYQPIHQVVGAKEHFDSAIQIGNILMSKGAKLEDISDINIYHDGQYVNIKKETAYFINNPTMLKWAMTQGYNEFDFTNLNGNSILDIYPFETFKILAAHYSLKVEQNFDFKNYLLRYLMDLKQLKSNEFIELFEIVRNRMLQEPNSFLENLKLVVPKSPMNKEILDYFLSLGIKKSDFNFEATNDMPVEDAILIKNYGAIDNGVVVGRNLAETKRLIKAGYTPNVYIEHYSNDSKDGIHFVTSGDAWMVAAHMERWDVADFIGKNGYLAKPIFTMGNLSPLVGAGIGFVRTRNSNKRIFKSSPEWFKKAVKTYSNFSKIDRTNWFFYALLEGGSDYNESDAMTLVKEIKTNQVMINEPMLAVYNMDHRIEERSPAWMRDLYWRNLRYYKVTLIHVIMMELDENYIVDALIGLSDLKPNYQIQIETGFIVNDPSNENKYKLQMEYSQHSHEKMARRLSREFDKESFYSKWKQFLIEYVSQGGDLNTPFFTPINFSDRSGTEYTYLRGTKEYQEGYNPLYTNNYYLNKAYLEVAKDFNIKIDINSFTSNWREYKNFSTSALESTQFCSINPLFINAIMPTDNVNVTELLVQYGADPNLLAPTGLCNNETMLALQLAIKSGNTKIADYLKKFLKVH